MEPVITRTTSVLHAVSGARGVFVNPLDDDDFRRHLVILDPEIYDDLGRPEYITVTIEPGDRLNKEEK
jgi:hypothetical protein